MNSPLAVLTNLPSTAGEVARFAKSVVDSVKNGEENPLRILVMLRGLEAAAELIRDEIGEEGLNEAEKHTEKKFAAYGAVIERAEVGTKYLYNKTGDVEWERLNSEFETLKRRKEERENFLKSMREPITAVDEGSGEVYRITPPPKTSKSGIKVFIK